MSGESANELAGVQLRTTEKMKDVTPELHAWELGLLASAPHCMAMEEKYWQSTLCIFVSAAANDIKMTN